MGISKPLKELFKEYEIEMKYSSCLRPETIRGYRETFELFMQLMPEVTTVGYINVEMLNEFFTRLQTRERLVGKNQIKTGVRNSTIKTYRSKLNCFFAWLNRNGHLRINPLLSIKPPKTVFEESKNISKEEIDKIYSSILLRSKSIFNQRRDTLIVSLLLFCGLRFGELVSLKVHDVDLDKQLLAVKGMTSKSQKIRFIPIHPTLHLHLQDYLIERNKRKYSSVNLLVSSKVDSGLTNDGLSYWVKAINKKADVKLHLHMFRHTFACNLADKNVHPIKIQRLLGHSSLNMTMLYLRSIKTEFLHEEINKL